MADLFQLYKAWREKTDQEASGHPQEDGDKRSFMNYAKLKRLDYDDFEELELQYDEYLIEKETETSDEIQG